MINHKRVRRTENGYYLFFPFGIYLSKGFATANTDEIEKAISREKRLTVFGLTLLFSLYAKFYNNKELWVGLFYVILTIIIIVNLYASAKTSFRTPEHYDPEKHGNLIQPTP